MMHVTVVLLNALHHKTIAGEGDRGQGTPNQQRDDHEAFRAWNTWHDPSFVNIFTWFADVLRTLMLLDFGPYTSESGSGGLSTCGFLDLQ